MSLPTSRREFLSVVGGGAIACAAPQTVASAAALDQGAITGDPFGDVVGQQMMSEGGNAIDAVVAAAFAASVTSLANCGVGGYGGHMMIGLANGQTAAIDFNGTAPASMTADFFANSQQNGGYLQRGWQSAGVPGVLAGLQLAIDRFGTKPLSELMQPAISIARDGFKLPPAVARTIQRLQSSLKKDPGSAKLLLPDGEPPQAGSLFRNPDLANMLSSLAEQGNVEPFYRGEIAEQIAAAFQRHDGLVTRDDLARFQARVVVPSHLRWNDHDIYTAPLTAGGVTSLQVLNILAQLGWDDLPNGVSQSHAVLEAQRIAWADRLKLFGDPEHVDVPLRQIFSEQVASQQARLVAQAVRKKEKVDVSAIARDHGGTCHISAADKEGNLVSLTFTHGQGFGALVTVDGLGLILGHGISRFETQPGHPNAPAAGKRPLNNMCPTIVLREGRPVLAVGGRGGRRIPNALVWFLIHALGENASFAQSIAGKRLHSEGDHAAILQGDWQPDTRTHFESLGYTVQNGSVARLDAVTFDAADRSVEKAFH